MIKFEIGKRYYMVSIGDSDCVWTYEVMARTEQTVTLAEVSIRDGELKDPIKRKIIKALSNESEAVFPLGQYSMAPILRATNERIEAAPAEDPADIITAPELVASVVYDFGSIDEEETTEEAPAADQLTLDMFFNLPEETPAADPAPEKIREETPAEEEKAPETATESPEEVATAKYYDVSEATAERAWYCVHMGDYKKGSATAEYRSYVDEATQIAEAQKKRVSPFYHDKIDALLDRYSKKLATWFNDYNRNEASCPSWFISGPANYPVRKHERKMSRERSLWEEYHDIQAIKDKIKSIGTGPIDLSDPHAREMLEERLQKYQNELELDKRLNAYYRKHNTLIGCPDLSESAQRTMTAAIEETRERCPWITKPAPDYELTSLRDKIKRTQERLEELNRREAAIEAGADNNTAFEGGEIIRNIELDRLQIVFDDKPDEEMRAALKENGFRWSPKNNAWQRQLTENAERALKRLNLL